MSRAFVYSILAVLLIAVHSIIAFSSNIHEKMTRSERYAVFGSEDSVPEYQVFTMSLPGARRRRETDEVLKLNIQLDGKKVDLILKPTGGYLATKHTPVSLATGYKYHPDSIQYEPLPTAMSDIGEFKMYHDVANEAALTTYEDPTEGTIIEGIITPYYAIRSLPKRLMDETFKVRQYIMSIWDMKKRSITSDTEEDTGYFAVFKVPAGSNYVKPSALVDPGNLQREKRARGTGGEREFRTKVSKAAVYPQILLVLDHNAIRNHTITQALRYILAFWNAADLIYRAFDNPKVHLNIAGIIIGGTDQSTPYIASDVSVNILGDTNIMLSQMGKYFYKENVRFPRNNYDIVIAMTTIKMCGTTSAPCYSMFQNADRDTACLSKYEVSTMKTVKGKGIIGYNWEFTGVTAAVETLAFIFGAKQLTPKTGTTCSVNEGDLMTKRTGRPKNPVMWSECSRIFLSRYFSSDKSQCLDNKPLWTKVAGPVLPGRWMSMNGQCVNRGFDEACDVKGRSRCSTLGCKFKGSVCIDTFRIPLPGSKCGSYRHCSVERTCVFSGWDGNA